ncbi:MAG: ATP-binding domain-containing protein, partial [Myxococcota bacterium]
TVHKVQGSEFPSVIMVLHASHHVLLSRSLVYTGLTRARKLAVFLGDPGALERSVKRSGARARNSHLAPRLRQLASSASVHGGLSSDRQEIP